jgi:hypothetical protein
MVRIEHDPKLDIACIIWKDITQPLFHAEVRRLVSIPLYVGTARLEFADKPLATPVAVVLATTDGKPDWHRGVGVILKVTEAGQSTSDFFIKVIGLAFQEDLIDAHAADQARHEVILMTVIRN